LITTKWFTNNYSFETLNTGGHFLRAFVDKNKNKKLDIKSEPFAEENVADKPVATVDLVLTYSDSTAPALSRVSPLYTDELELSFDENLVKVHTVHLLTDSLGQALRIKRWRIADDKLRVFTAAMDTIDYKILVTGAEDKKGNIAEIDSLVFKGIIKTDTVAVSFVKIDPRDGSSVTSLQPEIKVTFSEIVFREHAKAWLTETETGLKYSMKTVSGDNEVVVFKPLVKLHNFNTYRIMVEAEDPRGNQLSDFAGSVFLPIVREELKE